MSAARVMGELRSELARPYGEGSWLRLCEVLEPCLEMSREQWRAEIEPYVTRALSGWPQTGRLAPMSWVLRAAGGADAGPLRLAREIVLDPQGAEVLWGDDGLVALVESPDFDQILRLEAPGAGFGDACALGLARTPHAGRLESLILSGNDISSQGARFLARSNSLKALRELDLSGNEQIGPAGVAAFWEAAQSKRLRRLCVAGCRWDGDTFWEVYRPSTLAAVQIDIAPELEARWRQWWLEQQYM